MRGDIGWLIFVNAAVTVFQSYNGGPFTYSLCSWGPPKRLTSTKCISGPRNLRNDISATSRENLSSGFATW